MLPRLLGLHWSIIEMAPFGRRRLFVLSTMGDSNQAGVGPERQPVASASVESQSAWRVAEWDVEETNRHC